MTSLHVAQLKKDLQGYLKAFLTVKTQGLDQQLLLGVLKLVNK